MYALEKGFLCDPNMTLTLDLQTSLILDMVQSHCISFYSKTISGMSQIGPRGEKLFSGEEISDKRTDGHRLITIGRPKREALRLL